MFGSVNQLSGHLVERVQSEIVVVAYKQAGFDPIGDFVASGDFEVRQGLIPLLRRRFRGDRWRSIRFHQRGRPRQRCLRIRSGHRLLL